MIREENMPMEAVNKSLFSIIDQLRSNLKDYPRREPGWLEVGGVPFQFADLHSFYYQAKQIFLEKHYEYATDASEPFILDCGAHIGMSALYFALRHPRATIHAFEADADIAHILAKNVEAFGLDNVTAHNAAVWTHDHGVNFQVEGSDSGAVNADAATKAPSIRLRDILADNAVDMLKMDIEGAEFEVLEDCADVLRNVRATVLEAHCLTPEQKPGRILNLLEDAGFTCRLNDLTFVSWTPEKQTTPFTHIQDKRQLFNIYAWRS